MVTATIGMKGSFFYITEEHTNKFEYNGRIDDMIMFCDM